MRHSFVALCLFGAACGPPAGPPISVGDGGSTDDLRATGDADVQGNSLIGTWDLITTPFGGSAVTSTVVVAQDSLTITSPDFTLTASRSGNVLSFLDSAGGPGVFGGPETVAAFNAGLVPFTMGGSWALQGGPKDSAATVGCTLQVSATEIDATCNNLGPTSPWFSFTSTRGTAAASSFGDFGGTWNNVWVWGAPGTTNYPCALNFAGNAINTCAGGAMDGEVTGSPLAGIVFTYDGANTISGSAQGWAEFSATRQ